MVALKDALAGFSNLELGVCWASRSVTSLDKFDEDCIRYYSVPISRLGYYTQSFGREIEVCRRIVADFEPDVVHIHGTESFYGLMCDSSNTPSVIELNGILTKCTGVYFGQMALSDILRHPRVVRTYWDMRMRTRVERRIFRRGQFFIGRSLWDQSQVAQVNPSGCYYYVPYMLRKPFDEAHWNLDSAEKGVVYCTSSASPYKGVDTLIEAFYILRSWLPGSSLRVGGIAKDAGLGKFLWQIVEKLDLQDSVSFLGYLTAEEIACQLLQAHAYVLPSFIENSPNSLSEAMSVGVPCVASFVGGVPSLIRDEESGLLFPRGDAAVLAMQLKRILTDDALAEHLSVKGREIARERHDSQRIVESYLSIYRELAEGDQSSQAMEK